MRAFSVRQAPSRAPLVIKSQASPLISRRNPCARRGQLLTVRAAEKAVGPEPPSQADPSSGEDGAGANGDGAEAQAEASIFEKLLQVVRVTAAGGDAAEMEAEAAGLAASLQADTEQATAAYKQADEQLRQLKDQYRRLQADFDNFRARADQEKAKSGSAGKARVLEQLLPVIDNFEIAGKSIKTETEAEQKINDSYQSLYRQTVDIFRTLGLEAVPTVGTPFDPEMHDGVMREERGDVPDGQVLEEFRKGFKYKEELLRPAMVKVAVATTAPPPAEGGDEGKEEQKTEQA